jgi:aminotransferase EvaB
LGALGDGGAIATNSTQLAETVARLRQYGWSAKYEVTLGHASNSRLDEMQAAILLGFLPLLDAWNERRRELAKLYASLISNPRVKLPEFVGGEYVGHLYVVHTENPLCLRDYLKKNGVASEVHYPIPDYRQPVFKDTYTNFSLPNTDALAKSILTLPCYPELTDEQVHQIAEAVNSWQG